jgi:signal transduction histidine kinase
VIDNAYDAMMQRKVEQGEPNYKPILKVSADARNGHLNILFQDNGMGIKDEDKEKLFTPFFTTKATAKKGTGLGLYVIQKIIEENHKGKVFYESYYGEGTATKIRLNTMDEENKVEMPNSKV